MQKIQKGQKRKGQDKKTISKFERPAKTGGSFCPTRTQPIGIQIFSMISATESVVVISPRRL